MSVSALEEEATPAWGDLFADLFEKFVKNFSPDKVKKSINELRSRYPRAGPPQLAGRLISRASLKCSVAHTGAAALPLVGVPASLVADFTYVIDRQCTLVASIAYLYGHELSTDEAVKDILYCMGTSSGAFAGERFLANVVRQGLKGEALRALLKRLGIILSQRALARVIPLVGPVVGGICSYAMMRSIGRAAVELYARRTPTTPPVPYSR